MTSTPDIARMKMQLARLVAFDTQNPPGREVEAARYIGEILSSMGFAVDFLDCGAGRTNVVGVLANGPGPSFAFNTHIDVVPAGSGWSRDPFKLVEQDGCLYGRGACDAKGPLAAMLETLRLLAADRERWSGTLIGVFVADEEVGSEGAKTYARTAAPIDYCVIGEPTGCSTVTAHKGSLRPIVRVDGISSHSGMPDLGVNAILRSVPLLERIVAEHEKVRARTHDLVGSASLTVVRASAGVADNVVPDACEFVLDRRMVPGEEEERVLDGLRRLVEEAAREAGTTAGIVGFRPTTGSASETARDHPIVEASVGACRHHGNPQSSIGGFQGGCDLVHFRSLGAEGVVVGPGALAVAHKPDEFVPVEELTRSALIYRDIAQAMLGAKKDYQG
ncbi:MAG: ArgE/DapE family deacylase [Rhizobiales bacterium]|nr:ArgE/DapE family deacylase [Hyphomicrobiales bacterium]